MKLFHFTNDITGDEFIVLADDGEEPEDYAEYDFEVEVHELEDSAHWPSSLPTNRPLHKKM